MLKRIKIEVAELEIEPETGRMWIHNAAGVTVMRVQTSKKLTPVPGGGVTPFADVRVEHDILLLLPHPADPITTSGVHRCH